MSDTIFSSSIELDRSSLAVQRSPIVVDRSSIIVDRALIALGSCRQSICFRTKSLDDSSHTFTHEAETMLRSSKPLDSVRETLERLSDSRVHVSISIGPHPATSFVSSIVLDPSSQSSERPSITLDTLRDTPDRLRALFHDHCDSAVWIAGVRNRSSRLFDSLSDS